MVKKNDFLIFGFTIKNTKNKTSIINIGKKLYIFKLFNFYIKVF